MGQKRQGDYSSREYVRTDVCVLDVNLVDRR
jgi:hypothetical protein